jgi:hypothetical protein
LASGLTSHEDKLARKRLDERLGEEGWLVSIEKDSYPLSQRDLLVRVKDGKAVVVGGPLKPNQLQPQNRIPDEVDRHAAGLPARCPSLPARAPIRAKTPRVFTVRAAHEDARLLLTDDPSERKRSLVRGPPGLPNWQ